MESSSYMGFVNNVVLLLTIGFLYDALKFKTNESNKVTRNYLSGIYLSLLVIAIMLSPWEYKEGIIFDGRSIFLSISGLYFGWIPTLIAMLSATIYRYILGGIGVLAGIGVILSSGLIGLFWRKKFYTNKKQISNNNLFKMGFVVHIIMLLWMFALPFPFSIEVLSNISLPVILLYPIGTLIIGIVLRNKGDRIRKEKQYHLISQTATDAIISISTSGIIFHANTAAKNMFGIKEEDINVLSMRDLMPERFRNKHDVGLENISNGGNSNILGKTVEIHGLSRGGKEFPITLSLAKWEAEGENYYTGIIRDITDRKKKDAELAYLATYDSMTNLPNRRLFLKRLNRAIINARRNNYLVAVIFIDLDELKLINDAFGHEKGDDLIKFIGENISELLRQNDVASRIGGDEFAVLVNNINHPNEVVSTIERISKAISRPLDLDNIEISSSASMGISFFPKDGETEDQLIHNADMAMNSVKKNGKNGYSFFSTEIDNAAMNLINLRNELRHALPNNEFLLHYQPLINSGTNKIIGVEALIRWNHPNKGIVYPNYFMDTVEMSGLGEKVGTWVINTACKQLSEWIKRGAPLIRMAINISTSQLDSDNLVSVVEENIKKYGLIPELIELELSESILFKDLQKALPKLNELKKLGVRLSIDDFGTGYSSLSQLSTCQFDTLKIDQEFAKTVIDSQKTAAIVKGIVAIGRNLNISMVAEGIENKTQKDFYQSLGCETIQGFYYHKSLPPHEIERLVSKAKVLV